MSLQPPDYPGYPGIWGLSNGAGGEYLPLPASKGLSTTQLLSEQHEPTSLKTKIPDLLISYRLLHKIFKETPVSLLLAFFPYD